MLRRKAVSGRLLRNLPSLLPSFRDIDPTMASECGSALTIDDKT